MLEKVATTRLLEREAELASLAGMIERALHGVGSMVVIEGPAGIGKTSLLSAASEQARGANMTVLAATGGELERDFPFGIVRQLFEPPLATASRERQSELLDGAAAVAGQILGPGGQPKPDAPGRGLTPESVAHGLYWLTVGLTDEAPVLVAVDDAHWSDVVSLRCLLYLARRVADLPVLMLFALRLGPPEPQSRPLAGLVRELTASRLRPAPLGEEAVARLLREALESEPAPAFSAAVHAATGGIPFFVGELIAALARDHVSPSEAAAASVERLAPEAVIRHTFGRISRLAPEAGRLLRALAILGAEGHLRHAAGLAGLDLQTACSATDALTYAGLLAPGRPPRFAHPLLREAVYADIPAGERAFQHAEAAQRLLDEGAPVEEIGAHLLHTEPAGDAGTVELLIRAADAAALRGAPEVGATLLRRALAEPARPRLRLQLLTRLGELELLLCDPKAIEHFEAAHDLCDDPLARAALRRRLAMTLEFFGRFEDGARLFEDLLDNPPPGTDRDFLACVESDLLSAAQWIAPRWERVRRRVAQLEAHPPSAASLGERRLLAFSAQRVAINAGPAARALDMASAALADGTLIEESWPEGRFAAYAIDTLTFTGADASAERWIEALERSARAVGSIPMMTLAVVSRSLLLQQRGWVAALVSEAQRAIELARGYAEPQVRLAASLLADALAEQGDEDGAQQALTVIGSPEENLPTALVWARGFAAGRVALLAGRPADAAASLLEAGRQADSIEADGRPVGQWRPPAAEALALLGETREARRLAAEEVDLARRFGSPRPLGIALRALALTRTGEARSDGLRDAVSVLERSPSRLEYARALCDLGTALRHQRRRAEAREPLRLAGDLADRCGAKLLGLRAQRELRATGARPRRTRVAGVEALTPSERTVCEMAAAGKSNRQVAQELYITIKTVETHLARAYVKLEVRSRGQLADALAGLLTESSAPSSALSA